MCESWTAVQAPQLNFNIVATVAAGILFAIASAAIAQDQVPPLCTDEHELSRVKEQYEIAESFGSRLRVEIIQEIRETALEPSPADVVTFGTSHHGVNSRYCKAKALLSNGEEDTLFWRMDYVTGGGRDYVTHVTCFLRHDAGEKECEHARRPIAAAHNVSDQNAGDRHSREPTAAHSRSAVRETIIVDAPDGPTPQTRRALQRAQETGVGSITLKLQHIKLIQDEDLLRLIIVELEEILKEYGYSDESWTLIQCSQVCE